MILIALQVLCTIVYFLLWMFLTEQMKKIRRVALMLLPVVLVLITAPFCFTVISPGHRGVQETFGVLNETPLLPGPHIINPFSQVTKLDCRIKKMEDEFACSSSDEQEVSIKMMLNYRLESGTVVELYQEVGKEYVSVILEPALYECLKAEISKYSAGEILNERKTVKEVVQETLTAWTSRYNITIDEVAIANVDFQPGYKAAVEAKQIEEQHALSMEYKLQQAEKEKEMAVVKAEGEKESRVKQAEAEAEEIGLIAEARATAYQRLDSVITPNILNYIWIDAWRDGAKLPDTMLSSDIPVELSLPALKPGK